MKRKLRIYYSDSQQALIWERWRQGDSLQKITLLFDRNHSSAERFWLRLAATVQHNDAVLDCR